MGHVWLLSIQRHFFVLLGQISLPLLPYPFLLSPFFPSFISCLCLLSLLSVPLGQISLFCPKNLVLGCLKPTLRCPTVPTFAWFLQSGDSIKVVLAKLPKFLGQNIKANSQLSGFLSVHRQKHCQSLEAFLAPQIQTAYTTDSVMDEFVTVWSQPLLISCTI